MKASLIKEHVWQLSGKIGCRPVGSSANREAVAYIERVLREAGVEVERQEFPCLEWYGLEVKLGLGDDLLDAAINPYSPACQLIRPTVSAGNIGELESTELRDRIVIMYDALCREPLLPKNFTFYTVAEHQRIIQLLEDGGASAVIAVRDEEGTHPPIIEDGDLALPSVTVPRSSGNRLLALSGAEVALTIACERRHSQGANVLAHKRGRGGPQILLCAHLDTKYGTPGAIDNASGVALMLALAQASHTMPDSLDLEFVFFNGEDCYNTPGQIRYLEANRDRLDELSLVVNADGVGVAGQRSSIAFFNCDPGFEEVARRRLSNWPEIVEIGPWPQGDHAMFWQLGVPCIAFTSEGIFGLIDQVIHTERDAFHQLDMETLGQVFDYIGELMDPFPAPGRRRAR